MARSVDEIQAAIITDVQAQPELATVATNTSKRAIWRLWTYIVAAAINLLEQIIDIFKTQTETTVSLAAPETTQWLQDKVFKFQYDATTPQVLQLIDLVPQYPTVDTTKRIVTRCSVKTDLNNSVKIKVAKSSPPDALTSTELDALQSYVDILGVAGIYYVVTSQAADKLLVYADIYYTGSYSAVISNNVIAAIEGYFASLPFDGAMKLTDLLEAIRAVAGVTDVVFRNVQAREDGTTVTNGTDLVLNNQIVGRLWNTVAGYIVGETTSGYTLAETLNFIPE